MGSVLEQHGTRLHRLPPGAIVEAARADIKRAERKRDRGARLTPPERCVPYAFHRDHVRAAHSASELIDLALRDRQRGLSSGKRETRLIYADEDLLFQARITVQLGPVPARWEVA